MGQGPQATVDPHGREGEEGANSLLGKHPLNLRPIFFFKRKAYFAYIAEHSYAIITILTEIHPTYILNGLIDLRAISAVVQAKPQLAGEVPKEGPTLIKHELKLLL